MTFFKFEADFVESLRCIPMQVRLKLDTCGVKLKLSHWHHFSHSQRQNLIDLDCDRPLEIIAYREFLLDLIANLASKDSDKNFEAIDLSGLLIQVDPIWLDGDRLPPEVSHQAQLLGAEITLGQWLALSSLQRFALIKLSRSHHEHQNFLPALQEFNIWGTAPVEGTDLKLAFNNVSQD
jgi:hypothetical protein